MGSPNRPHRHGACAGICASSCAWLLRVLACVACLAVFGVQAAEDLAALEQKAEEAVTAMGAYIAHRVQIGDLKAPPLEVDDE